MDFNDNEEGALINLLAKSTGIPLVNGVLNFPPHIGTGYIRRLKINHKMHIFIRKFELKEERIVRRENIENDKNLVIIGFHNIIKCKNDVADNPSGLLFSKTNLPSALISSVGLDEEVIIPANVKTSSIVIAVYSDYLKELLDAGENCNIIQTIISGDQSFLFEEIISPEIQDLAAEIVNATIEEQLHVLYFRAKAEQLIYLLLVELLKRNENSLGMINTGDVKIIYRVRDRILENVNEPPRLEDLVMFSGMSKSKLQNLFKQVFGNSIYNYYQSFRMRQAAEMIHERVSISEVGYHMGFSNLSHFTRMFEKHIGVKPKKYASSNDFKKHS
nr:AraC family transcriptional regulator [uncultured Flavobacterium sp.]